MTDIPVYLKTDPQMPRPDDPEFYLLTGDGTFICRNHSFFESDVPASRQPRTLAGHAPRCIIKYPKLGVAALEYIVGFFDVIFRMHSSEAIVLLYWDLKRKRYLLRVPKQEATVWESYSGRRSPLDVRYTILPDVAAHQLLVGDIHSHGDIGAHASYMDEQDEQSRDGIHAVVGCIDRKLPQFHQEIVIDRHRFTLKFEHIFQGFGKRRRNIPQVWIDQVDVVVERSGWSRPTSNTTYGKYNSWNDKYSSWDYGQADDSDGSQGWNGRR